MENWITNIMEQFGYLGILLMMALENLFPPIPSEIVLPFGGFLTTYTNITVWGVVIAATIGSLLGAVILYWIGTLLDVDRLERIIKRWGRIARIKVEDVHKADAWFDKYGYWTVLIGRMVPVVRSLISIPAGMSNMRFGLFMLFTVIGTLIWNSILITVGVILGESWHDITSFMDLYSDIVYFFLAVIFAILLYLYFRKKRQRR
ncbi:Inner membrane protein YabI [Oceanobacillus picturae]|uniref:Inner membrane protein YabI n=1 Tax=Oceanobacillus picturae TaxID=171693 RepID=W9AKJ7_9BACI|nr:DedA family protein [Oceanobacillus picturae]CDO03176.1 Inner membrane protein YabI [Oceanobacillus picturae]